MKQFIIFYIVFVGLVALGITAASAEIIGPVGPVEIEPVIVEPREFEPPETEPLELEPAETEPLEIQALKQQALIIEDTDDTADEEEETSWIELDLKDEDGNLISPKRYKVISSNGEIREGDLDEDGIAYLSTLDPGECQISFPGLDSEAWDKEE